MVFPTTIGSDGSLYILTNSVATTLNGGVTSIATSLTLTSSNAFPPTGFITIETEAISYTANNTATSVISGATRGAGSTTAAIHADGTAVYHNYVSQHHNGLKDEIIGIETNLSDRLGATTTGIVSQVSNTTTATLIDIRNNQDTTTAHIQLKLIANTGAGGDPYIEYNIAAAQAWVSGVDNSASDAFKISSSGALGSSDVFVATVAGEITKPLQPSFLVTHSDAATDVTGDGTVWTATWNNEIYDQGGDFSSNTFTAPVTGRYLLSANILMDNILVTHAARNIRFVTSNRNYFFYTSYALAETFRALSITVVADMDSGDTVTVAIEVNGSTKTVDIDADGSQCFFSGSLIN